ncbi:hypothetical protein PIB30_048088 [Stylosanthes scabra]|uniref:O-methyltransferase C-terminal domain-containing protein n=1 Tax=Stylosanthes scabra TaxID=79078 RepID=A0ABU6WIX5_9FABA|nr:hypothetical protein [Stylosanthes scabra]
MSFAAGNIAKPCAFVDFLLVLHILVHQVMKNCSKAIPEDGKVIVVDTMVMVPVWPENTTAAKVAFKCDLIMMTQNIGGKERTKHEFIQLANDSGFSAIKFVCSVSGYWVMEFYK